MVSPKQRSNAIVTHALFGFWLLGGGACIALFNELMPLNRPQQYVKATSVEGKQETSRVVCLRAATMKIPMSALVIVIIMCMIPTAVSGEHGIYRLRSRVNNHEHRELQVPLSFSGDLDPIIEAAEELAELEDTMNGGTTPPPPSGPSSDTRIGCEDETKDKVIILQFKYEMEALPSSIPLDDRDIILQDQPSVQESLEKSLNEALANKLLYCPDIGYTASDENTKIVAYDSAPDDTPGKTCDTTDSQNTCQVMSGEMSVWHTADSDSDRAMIEYVTMISIRNYLNSDPDIPGLVRTKYLSPAIKEPEPPNGATDGDTDPSDSVSTDTDSGLNNRSIIFMSLASVGFVAAVGLVTYFRMRKTSRQEDVPYVATLENESSGEESPSRLSSSNDESNFSSIMPSNYRLDVSESPFNSIAPSSMGSMGTIHESDDAHSDGQRSDDIIVSDGYTTEGDSSIEFPSYFGNNYVANAAPVLGARPRTVSFALSCVMYFPIVI